MGYSSTQANEMLMGLPGAMAAMGKKAYMGLGNLLEKKIIEASLPKYGMDEAYPGELSSPKPVSTEGNPEFIPFVKTDRGYEGRLPGIAGDAYNAFTAPYRSMVDPNFNAPEEAVNMGLNLMGGGTMFGRVPAGSLAMNAYHGSPHRFLPTAKNPLGEFAASKIGTGEGAQAYGHGLYLAEHPTVAEEYATKLSKPVTTFGGKQISEISDPESKRLADWIQSNVGVMQFDARHYEANRLFNTLTPEQQSALGKPSVSDAGSLYKVDLPDDRIAKMLDYDKPLSEQHPDVQSALAKLDPDTYSPTGLDYSPEETGQMIYMRMANSPLAKTQADASEVLRQAGIPGIRYLDGGSRSGGKGTSNFVVFDPADTTILERNGMTAQDVLAQEGKGLVPPVGKGMVAKAMDVPDLKQMSNKWESQGIKNDVFENGNKITLSKIVVPKESRNSGIGSKYMKELLDYADASGKRVELSPSDDFGGNKNRLKEFYSRFGFIENKGKNKDFSTMQSMYREPIQSVQALSVPSKKNIVPPVKRVAPQDEALRLAQERAALPVEQGGLGLPVDNTPEQRAMAMGFDTSSPLFFGSTDDISALDKSKIGSRYDYSFGHHTTSSPEEASNYAQSPDNMIQNFQSLPDKQVASEGGNVMPLVGRSDNPLQISTTQPAASMEADLNRYDIQRQLMEAINAGKPYDSVIIDALDGNKNFISLNPDNIRSRFAAFDPYRKSAAVAAAMGVAAPDLMADEKQKPAKKNIVPPVKKQGK